MYTEEEFKMLNKSSQVTKQANKEKRYVEDLFFNETHYGTVWDVQFMSNQNCVLRNKKVVIHETTKLQGAKLKKTQLELPPLVQELLNEWWIKISPILQTFWKPQTLWWWSSIWWFTHKYNLCCQYIHSSCISYVPYYEEMNSQ